jgi:cell pole-organizing protein PopZ
MSEPNAQEPTMEEILASIRRIISEDEPAAAVEAAPAPESVAEPEPVAVAPEPEPEPEHEEEDVLELTEPIAEPEPAVESHGDLDVYAAPEPEPEPAAHYEPEPPPRAFADDEPLVGRPAAAASASAFGHLAQRIAMPQNGRSLEDVVRELLNPLLKAWLDEHLPAIVQAKVDEEVERIARRRLS